MKNIRKEKTMDELERLEDEKRKLVAGYSRSLQVIEDKIAKKKESIRRQKERDKKQKELQKQNNTVVTDIAYQSFVKDSMSIAEINQKMQEFLN